MITLRKRRLSSGDIGKLSPTSPTKREQCENGGVMMIQPFGIGIHNSNSKGKHSRGLHKSENNVTLWMVLGLASFSILYLSFPNKYSAPTGVTDVASRRSQVLSDSVRITTTTRITLEETIASLLPSRDPKNNNDNIVQADSSSVSANEMIYRAPAANELPVTKIKESPVRVFPSTVHLEPFDAVATTTTKSYFFTTLHPLLPDTEGSDYNDVDWNHTEYVSSGLFERFLWDDFFHEDEEEDGDYEEDETEWVDEYYLQYEERDFPLECIMPAWTDLHFPACNTFHESMTQERFSKSESSRYLASGFYRDTFLWKSSHTEDSGDDEFVLKRLKYAGYLKFIISLIHQMRTEALIMERLSSSPRVTQIYGFCATSLAVEPAQEITHDIVPFNKVHQKERGRIAQTDLDRLQQEQFQLTNSNIVSFNNFTAEEKLDIVTQVAEAIAEMHGFAGSLMVNDDVHPDQWLQVPTENGRRVIMNDMNNAAFMKWNPVKQDYCQYWQSYGGDFHAPESFAGDHVDESTDLWPFGNMIFILLTGLWPYYDIPSEREEELQNRSIDGELPYLNPAYNYRSLIEHRLFQLMKLCHKRKPTERITIFEAVQHLYQTQQMHEQEQMKMDQL